MKFVVNLMSKLFYFPAICNKNTVDEHKELRKFNGQVKM